MTTRRTVAAALAVAIALSPLLGLLAVSSSAPATRADGGPENIMLYFKSGGGMDTAAPTALLAQGSTGDITFDIEVGSTLTAIGAEEGGDYGLYVSFAATAPTPPLTDPDDMTLTVLDDGDVVAELDIGASDYPGSATVAQFFVPFLDPSATAHTFESGSEMSVSFDFVGSNGADRVFYGSSSVGSHLLLRCTQVTSISARLVDVRGAETATFYPNDWPWGELSVDGRVVDALGYDDIASISYEISGGQTDAGGLANFSDDGDFAAEYEFTWNYTGLSIDSGLYDCVIVVADLQGNEYTESFQFEFRERGLLLTSVDQATEGSGVARKSASYGGGAVYEIRVRNTGTTSLNVSFSLTGPDASRGTLQQSRVLVPGGEMRPLNLTIDASGLAVYAKINITLTGSASGVSHSIQTLTTVSPYGVSVAIDDPSAFIVVGQGAEFDITIRNTGTVSDTYDVEIETLPGGGWTAELDDDSISLGKGASGSVTLTLTAPTSLVGETSEASASVKVTSGSDDGIYGRASAEAEATIGVRLEVTGPRSKTAEPEDQPAQYDLRVHNLAREDATFLIAVEPDGSGWEVSQDISVLPSRTLSVGAGSSMDMIVSIVPTMDVAAGRHDIAVTATRSDNSLSTASEEVQLTVSTVVRVDVSVGEMSGDARPGKSVTFEIEVENEGNAAEVVDVFVNVTARGESFDGWAELESSSLTVARRSSDNLTLTVTIPKDAVLDEYTVLVTVEDSTGERTSATPVRVQVDAGMAERLVRGLTALAIPLAMLVVLVMASVFIYRKRR